MEEGERLSIKQSNMETTIKKLRGQVKELEASHTQTAAKLAAEEAKTEAATQARQKAEAAAAASLQQHKADAEQQKQHFGNLLKEAHRSQVRLYACQSSRAHSSRCGSLRVSCNRCIPAAAVHDLLLYEQHDHLTGCNDSIVQLYRQGQHESMQLECIVICLSQYWHILLWLLP